VQKDVGATSRQGVGRGGGAKDTPPRPRGFQRSNSSTSAVVRKMLAPQLGHLAHREGVGC
jgi:hypothetical protein